MEEKRPIDRKRDSSGHFDVDDDTDGAIQQTLNVDGKLLVIKDKAIYEVTFADHVDPERKNIDIPPVIQKKVLNLGTESEMVSKTYLMALGMFKKEFLAPYVDLKKAQAVVLELLIELNALNEELESYLMAEQAATDEYNKRKELKLDYKLPSVTDLHTRLKTFFQKADHVLQSLMEINAIFFVEQKLNLRAHFDTFHTLLVDTFGQEDGFSKFIEGALPFLKVTRALRDCFDHRLENVQVQDFTLQLNNDVLTPTIAMEHRKEKLEPMPVSELLKATTENLLYVAELSIAYLAAKHPRPVGLMYQVKEIPLEKRMNKHIRYAFWAPIGPDGFFMQ